MQEQETNDNREVSKGEKRTCFVEERGTAAVLLGHDDLVKEHDAGVINRPAFALVDELVECYNAISCAAEVRSIPEKATRLRKKGYEQE
jgi:hypothetical protein